MKIYELEEINYFINEKEAFDKSVFNPAEYNVTLAVKKGTELSDFITEGQQVSGEYTVNGLTTNFESLVQDVSINRQFQAGYDMYNLKLSENILNVDRAAILDVQDGGTGAGTLNGILKGNGLSPVSSAVDGSDYWSPETLQVDQTVVPWTPLTMRNVKTATADYCVKNGNVYISARGNWGSFTGNAKDFATLPEPALFPAITIQNAASTQGGNRQMAAEVRSDGVINIICSALNADNMYGAFLISYPIGLGTK